MKRKDVVLKYLFFAGIILFFAVALVVLLVGYSSAHCCYKTPTSTPTATATLPPPPPLETCQVVGVVFGRESYLAGDTIEVTVRVADSAGTPLVGANVNAEVNRQPLNAQAATGFGLVDRAGDYDGTFDQTQSPGIYIFQFTVSDPTGERFLPCTGTAEILVDDLPTPTPTTEITATITVTPTDTPIPTDTPTPTSTPTPTDTPTPTPTFTPTPRPGVSVLPQQLNTTLCSLRDTMQVRVENVVDLAVVEMELSYDPGVVQVIDADAGQRGVQVRVNNAFSTDSIFENQVDTARGIISFGAGVIGVPAINGSSGLIAIDFRPQQVGNSDVTINSLSLLNVDGQPISATVASGAVTVNFVTNCLEGTVALEGRSSAGGVLVTNGAGQQTTTLPDGSFSIPASETLSFEFPGYLAAQANLAQTLAAKADDGPVVIQTVTLPAGDINGDNSINLIDLAYLATNFLTANGLADLNGDGTANILDLSLLAGNFQLQGPVVSNQ